MSKRWLTIAAAALGLVCLGAGAQERATERASDQKDKPARGAKALFGTGMRESFMPREEGGTSRQMNASANVTEQMLTSFYKAPEFPGMAYSIEVIRRGEANVITVGNPQTYEFMTGDRIRIRLIPNYTGHAYVMESKGGAEQLVYPVAFGTPENMVVAGRECYVPTSGWLALTDPPGRFTMKVLFKPGQDYQMNQAVPNPAAARVAISDAVAREWRSQFGSKGIVYEADQSYINVPPLPAGAGAAPGQAPMPAAQPQAPAGGAPQPMPVSMPMPTMEARQDYTTNYVAFQDAAAARSNPAIAIEVPINHVGRR
jgi:hypothetical protein